MNDEDIKTEYLAQMKIILDDDPNVSEKLKGIAEGMTIKLGEMMDKPRHQRIVRCAAFPDQGGLAPHLPNGELSVLTPHRDANLAGQDQRGGG